MNRLIHVRMMLALAMAGVAGTVALATTGTSRVAAVAKAESLPAPIEQIPTLATISVYANSEIPTLPLVIVRPDKHEAPLARTAEAVASAAGGSPALNMADALPHARLDMPYYSFGKLLPRTIKD